MINTTTVNPVCSIHGNAYHNGRCPMCDEAEGITTIQDAGWLQNIIDRIKTAFCGEREDMRIELFKDVKGKWRFRIVSKNNKIVAQSEGYANRRNCLDTAKLFKLKIVGSVRPTAKRSNANEVSRKSK